MSIRLTLTLAVTPNQVAWLQAHVVTGNFTSVEEAARCLMDERIVGCEIERDNLE